MFAMQRRDRRVCRQARFLVESLDDRLVLSAGATVGAVVNQQPAAHAQIDPQSHPRDTLEHGSPAELPLNVASELRTLYGEYEEQGGGRHFSPSLTAVRPLVISGYQVAVRIKVAFPPALGAYVSRLEEDGLRVTRTVPAYGLAEGLLPIGKLPAVAQLAAHVWHASLSIPTHVHPHTHRS